MTDIQAVTNGLGERVTTKQGRLVAMEAVPAGTFLAQFTGEVLAKEELENRMANLYQMGQPLYLLPLGQTALVDATKKGSIARLGVHSCNPSAEVKPWLVEVKFLKNYLVADLGKKLKNTNPFIPQIGGVEQQVLAMYSLKPLAAGDPITYDFSPQLELLKTSKVVESRESRLKQIIVALHVRRHQLPTHLGQLRENSWSSTVYSMSGTYSSGKEDSCT